MSEHIDQQIGSYLDDELQGPERRAFEAHVERCPSCRAALDREQRLDAFIRRARPLYRAPSGLRARIEGMLPQAHPRSGATRAPLWLALAATLVVGLGLSLWLIAHLTSAPPSQPSDFALLAVETHQRYTRGQLPLEVETDSPDKIADWFSGKLPFNLKLPNYPVDPGQTKPYQVAGARLIGFKNDYAAYVAYRLRNRQISLLVTSGTLAQPTGGQEIPWQDLQFRLGAVNGWKVLTWSDDGLTYVLVSDFEERGQTFCNVCHPGRQDLRMLKGLKPK